MNRMLALLSLAAAVALLALPGGAAAGTDPTHPRPPKASSFAPRHSKSHVYGSPVSKPILHKRNKRPHAAAASPGAGAPIK
ncbi:MAG TPA: hypothetical protein VLV25_08075 [Steroidobacteraceae bacterium]|nr:hypothetical protein [Steroidobacteraceae bacterium]